MIVQCADERSQLKNKTRAMKVLRSRLLQAKQEEERQKYADHRRGKSVPATEVSEFVPTISSESYYRPPYWLHNSQPDGVLDGELFDLVDHPQVADNQAKVQALMEELCGRGLVASTLIESNVDGFRSS